MVQNTHDNHWRAQKLQKLGRVAFFGAFFAQRLRDPRGNVSEKNSAPGTMSLRKPQGECFGMSLRRAPQRLRDPKGRESLGKNAPRDDAPETAQRRCPWESLGNRPSGSMSKDPNTSRYRLLTMPPGCVYRAQFPQGVSEHLGTIKHDTRCAISNYGHIHLRTTPPVRVGLLNKH